MTSNVHGWEKIVKVEPEVFTDENDRVWYEHVWLIGDRGNIFVRALLKGETVEGVANYYSKRGFTDGDCIVYRAVRRTVECAA